MTRPSEQRGITRGGAGGRKKKNGKNEAFQWMEQGWAPGEIKEEKGGEAAPQEGGLSALLAAHC